MFTDAAARSDQTGRIEDEHTMGAVLEDGRGNCCYTGVNFPRKLINGLRARNPQIIHFLDAIAI